VRWEGSFGPMNRKPGDRQGSPRFESTSKEGRCGFPELVQENLGDLGGLSETSCISFFVSRGLLLSNPSNFC
jgi:hypothetical protein